MDPTGALTITYSRESTAFADQQAFAAGVAAVLLSAVGCTALGSPIAGAVCSIVTGIAAVRFSTVADTASDNGGCVRVKATLFGGVQVYPYYGEGL